MSAADAEASFHYPLRRTRSTGDVPRRPSHVHRPDGAQPRHSDSHSDLGHQHQYCHCSTSGPDQVHSPLRPTETIPMPGPSTPRRDSQALSGGQSRAGQVSPPQLQPQTTPQPQRSWFARALLYFGIGRGAPRERRTIVALYFTLLSGSVQIIVISVILGLAGTRLKSPTQPSLTEWVACNRPLGIWACIWVVRAILACSLTFWGFLRDRKVRQRLLDPTDASSTSQRSTSPRAQNGQSNSPPAIDPPEAARNSRDLPYARLYSRLTLLSSLLTLSWFLTAHILEYTSINTCRHSSPHVWWLTFGILCLMYLSVLEVIILSVVVFILAPILFLFWNIILICMGRHPLQTGNIIRPEIGKLSKSVVDMIPLVIYIPPPPEGLFNDPLPIPDPAHAYPPKLPEPAIAPSRKRFRFIRMLSSKNKQNNTLPESEKDNDVEKAADPQTWEEYWEKGKYPFVVLEGNRAACAICLMDFEEPKRLGSSTGAAPSSSGLESAETERASADMITSDPVIVAVTSQDGGDELKLADAGEGVQPLRLLECGHVFHKTCLDPWLTDVSGRCPVCQRAVELPELKKTRNQRR